MAVVRGEAATILRCKPKRVIPTNHHTACCSNLPVLDLHQDIGENPTLFITPFTRIITSNCNPTTCSAITPVVHYGQDGTPICQTGGLLQTCNGGTKISPVLSTPDIVFQPLSMDKTQETDLHYMNKKQVTNMINEVITSNFIQNKNVNHLIRNVFNCNGNVICSPENSIDPNYDLELARRTNSHTSFVFMFDWRAWAVKTTLVVFIIWIFWRAALQ